MRANIADRVKVTMDKEKDKARTSIFPRLPIPRPAEDAKDEPSPELTPAMPELGTAPCPVCGHSVAVFVTRTKRPFINCGFCSARIFYNGSRSMQLLKEQIQAAKKSEQSVGAKAFDGLKVIGRGKE